MSEASKYTSKTISATLEIGKTTIPVSSVTLRHTIDELPYAEIWVQLDNRSTEDSGVQGVVDMNSEKFRKLMQLFQEKILNEFKILPDCRLTVVDPNGYKLTFNGFLGKPDFVMRDGQVNLVVGMIHAKAALQAWNGMIYNYIQPYVLNFVDAFGEKASSEAQKADEGKSVSARVLALVEYAMRSVTVVPNQNDRTEYDMLPVHLLNQRAMPVVSEVLTASKTTTEIDGLQDDEFDDSNLNNQLFEVLRNSPSMWDALVTFGHMFLFQTNADWQGRLWLEPIQSTELPKDRIISVPTSDIRFNAATLFQIPLLQVIVVGGDNELYVLCGNLGVNQGAPPSTPIPTTGAEHYAARIAEDGDLWTKMSCISKYPAEVDRDAVGNFFVLQAPSWVNTDAILDAMLTQLESGIDPELSRFENAGRSFNNVRDTLLANGKPRIKLLTYMAEQLFKSLFLANTSASVTIPFDVRPMVGRTYEFEDIDGHGLFIGYLKDVVHSVSLNADGASTASTTLFFTHIQVTGAQLKQLLPVLKPVTTFLGDINVDKSYIDPDSINTSPSMVATVPNNIA